MSAPMVRFPDENPTRASARKFLPCTQAHPLQRVGFGGWHAFSGRRTSQWRTAAGNVAKYLRRSPTIGYCVGFILAAIILGSARHGRADPFFNPASSFSGPHPAVVRVAVPERDGASYGSGALVAVNESSGLVLTNWHVVRDVAGPIVVYFPDGFRSVAYLLRTDREWDLAALAIRRPKVAPIPLAPRRLGPVIR